MPLAVVVIVAAACGAGPGAVQPSDPFVGSTSDPAATSPASSSPGASPAPRHPNLDRYTDPLDRYTYRASFDRCAIAGVEGLAGDYGGDAADPESVARAYARFVDPTHEEAAAAGCLDGLAYVAAG